MKRSLQMRKHTQIITRLYLEQTYAEQDCVQKKKIQKR